MMPLATPFGGEKTGDDPHWDKVVLLANMNGANASTTFIDSSPNFATANGDAKVTNSVTIFGDTVGAFDGTGDFINLPYLPDYDVGSSNFTIEYWFKCGSISVGQVHFDWRDTAAAKGILISQSSANPSKVTAFIGDSNVTGWEVTIIGTTTLVVGTMYHVRLVKNGTNLQLYLQGATQGSATSSVVPYINSSDIRFGASRDGSAGFNGNAADLMISNVARNSSGFTPPSARLVADANTLVLIPMNGENNSVLFENIAAIIKIGTANGNVSVTNSVLLYSDTVAIFDGTGDFINFPYRKNYNFLSGNFTIEYWFKCGSVSVGQVHFDWRDTYAEKGVVIYQDTSTPNKIKASVGDSNSSSYEVSITGTTTLMVGTMYHVRLVKNGTNWKLYLKGISEGSATSSVVPYVNLSDIRFGIDRSGGDGFLGYAADLRITTIARNTVNFTPPRRRLGKHSPW